MLLVCFLSDILNKNREINKLKYKTNWIAAFTCLKKAIPTEWYHILQPQYSIKSVGNFQKDKFIVNEKSKAQILIFLIFLILNTFCILNT